MKTQFRLLMIAFMAIMTACSPEDGKDGKDGEQGIQGPAGQDGNANVTSYLFENVPINVGQNPFLIPEITKDIIDYGVVLGYLASNSGSRWFALPFVNELGDEIRILYIYEGGLMLISNVAARADFRFVVIEGSAGNRPNKEEGKSSKEAIYEELEQAGIDINDYNAVANYYNLQN